VIWASRSGAGQRLCSIRRGNRFITNLWQTWIQQQHSMTANIWRKRSRDGVLPLLLNAHKQHGY